MDIGSPSSCRPWNTALHAANFSGAQIGDQISCFHPGLTRYHSLALIRFFSQCLWLKPPILTPDQALCLSTHSMKSTLLAAAGQLNLNIEQRAKQGHHKQSVQLYSRDDVWPSLFLQRDILIEIGSGWRPLTSQARGAKHRPPEPIFFSPPITEKDLQSLQMITRSKNQNIQTSTINGPSKSIDDDSSSSSESDSCSSSDEDDYVPPVQTSPCDQQEISHCSCCFTDQLRINNSISIQDQRQFFWSQLRVIHYWSLCGNRKIHSIRCTCVPTTSMPCCFRLIAYLRNSPCEKWLFYVPSAHAGQVPKMKVFLPSALVF